MSRPSLHSAGKNARRGSRHFPPSEAHSTARQARRVLRKRHDLSLGRKRKPTQDGFGRKKTASFGSGLNGTWGYDNLNRIEAITWQGAGENFSQQLFYDPLKDVITDQVREFGNWHFGYDNDQQLSSVHYAGTKALPSEIVNRTFAYDKTGNRLETSVIANTLIESPSFSYELDSHGWGFPLTRKDIASGVGVDASEFSSEGKLQRFENGAYIVEYATDALGRRVAKRISPKNGDPAFTQSVLHLAGEDRVLLAKNGEGALHLYVDANGVDEHLGHVGPTGAVAYTTDHLGSVLNGEAAGDAQAFGAWGELLGGLPGLTAASAPIRYAFTGRELDAESGLYYHRFRMRDPATSRFLTPDPIGFSGGDENFWRYSYNQPTRMVDPWGLDFGLAGNSGFEYYPDGGGPPQWYPGASGPWGNGAAPEGPYVATEPPAKVPFEHPKQSSFCDASGNCWFQPVSPYSPSTRNGLGIHPDGGVPGTAGCVGLKDPDTEGLYNLLKNRKTSRKNPLWFYYQK